MEKVPRSRRTREALRKLMLEGSVGEEDPKSSMIRLAVQAVVEESLEAVVREMLGRDYYQRKGEEDQGHRNGYRKGRLATGEGEVCYAAPEVRGVENGPVRKLKELLRGRSEALEQLAVEMWARGCSTRDIEDIFRQEGGRSLLSKSAVSQVTEALWEEYEEFATRDLSEIKPLYLFLDGVAERLRPGAKREAVLCAWCLTWSGQKVLIHLAPGTKESTECCVEFLQEMKRRGLDDPLLVITDGAAGLIRAVEQCFPPSVRQRCLAHKLRNIANKLPEEIRAEFKEAARASYQAPSTAMARALRDDLVERYAKAYPSAVRCFQEDFEACIAHLRFPTSHRRMIRTTNLLERLLEEERRRTKVAPSVFGERPVLKMMYAATIRASDRWRGLRITEFERAHLQRLQKEQLGEHSQAHSTVEKPRPAQKPKGGIHGTEGN